MNKKEFKQKYNDWNIKKQNINFINKETLYFKEGDVWWCSFFLKIVTQPGDFG